MEEYHYDKELNTLRRIMFWFSVLLGLQLGFDTALIVRKNPGVGNTIVATLVFFGLGWDLLATVLFLTLPKELSSDGIGGVYSIDVSNAFIANMLSFALTCFSSLTAGFIDFTSLFLVFEHLVAAALLLDGLIALAVQRHWMIKHSTKEDARNTTVDAVEDPSEPQHDKAFVMLYDYDETVRVEKIIFCGKLVSAIGSKPASYAKLLDIRDVLEDKTARTSTLQLSDTANGKLEIVSQHVGGMSYKPAAAAREKIIRMLRREATMQKTEDKNREDLNDKNPEGGTENDRQKA